MLFRILAFSFILTLLANTSPCAGLHPNTFFLNTDEMHSVNVSFGAISPALPVKPYILSKNPDERSSLVFRPADITSGIQDAIDTHRTAPTPAFEMALNFHLTEATLSQVMQIFQSASYADKVISLHLLWMKDPLPDGIFADFTNLRHLTIGYSCLPGRFLERIAPRTFAGLRKLEVLSIQDAKLRTIEDGAFDDLVSLRALVLCGCLSLDKMPMNPTLLPKLEHLDIGMTAYFKLFSENRPRLDPSLLAFTFDAYSSDRLRGATILRLVCSKPTGTTEGSLYNRFVRQVGLLSSDAAGAGAVAGAGGAGAAAEAVVATIPEVAVGAALTPLPPEESTPAPVAVPQVVAEVAVAAAPEATAAETSAASTPSSEDPEEAAAIDAHPSTAEAPAPLPSESTMPAPVAAVAVAPQSAPETTAAATEISTAPEEADANAASSTPEPAATPPTAAQIHPAQPMDVPAVRASCSPHGCVVQ